LACAYNGDIFYTHFLYFIANRFLKICAAIFVDYFYKKDEQWYAVQMRLSIVLSPKEKYITEQVHNDDDRSYCLCLDKKPPPSPSSK